MNVPGGGHEPAPAPDDVQARIGKRLDDVAKILAGALVTVAGVMTALGLTSDVVFVALNNESWPIYVASLCAILAIVCSIVALLIHPTRRGNMWETVVLTLGVVFYMVALSVAVIGAAQAAGGNGRPTLTHVKLVGPESGRRLTFGVHADGVDRWASVNVYVTPLNADQANLPHTNDIYNVSLRPNDKGEIEHRTDVPFAAPRDAWGIEIIVVTAGGKEECEVRSPHGPTCAVVQLPQPSHGGVPSRQ
ncbi:hypothetical protein FCH28_01800 [Streptomyces piniterrae]|uniref:Uncharacterized protein n=1 Tax=Streptomyces piniterrae TaxID=2571125 RepID=A0A4U0NVZ5_9ACTN|nr:hypothetical protein [Streptomyces piniterrae]TJZ58915.1 hypothetical protein FCH28_01800 [Streptomyces piniterrae]